MLHETVESSEALRWKILKAMLDEFPELRQRAEAYLKKTKQ
jgi:hypothetical protein